ncbi:hypothetical protein T01_1926 [Trichinella spiralis]|uniref:Uncharacterized protein n=1 Tax=Trichinella spiralis TaxID=6334 RepID=A0A0V1AM47_TRISP|nr:hypothetical protein T01_1926 [Trichinella spiralis]
MKKAEEQGKKPEEKWAVNAKSKANKAEEERKRPKKKQENFIEEVKSCTQTKKAEEQAKKPEER